MDMPAHLGPWRTLTTGGAATPWYVLAFDASGDCTSVQTRAMLLDSVARGEIDRVVLFSHGWNNDWSDVEGLSSAMYRSLDGALAGGGGAGRLALVSLFWPSIDLVLSHEQGPRFAGDDPAAADAQLLAQLAADMAPADAARLSELYAKGATLDDAERLELVALLTPAGEDEAGEEPPPPVEIDRAWRAAGRPRRATSGTFGLAGEGAPAEEPAAAGMSFFDPRTYLRLASVRKMKDRAGTVGARGCGPLLRELLAASDDVRVHLAGHSYGCRVVLSALCAAPLPRPAASALLLQPAVSRYCFAERLPEQDRPGGYVLAPERVVQPILTTFSARDMPLRQGYQLGLRRAGDIGEAEIAGPGDSLYAALGGYGPAGTSLAHTIAIKAPGEAYDLSATAPRILAVDGSTPPAPGEKPPINGHGDVANDYTGWMLACQLTR